MASNVALTVLDEESLMLCELRKYVRKNTPGPKKTTETTPQDTPKTYAENAGPITPEKILKRIENKMPKTIRNRTLQNEVYIKS